jgi:hypothetical protein
MRSRRSMDQIVVALLIAWLASGCQAEADRQSQLRSLIKQNLHFNLHCFCVAVTNETVPEIMKEISDKDIPVLVELLGDKDIGVYVGAQAVLEKYGDAAVPALTEAAKTGASEMRFRAGYAISMIRFNKANGISR